MKLQLLFALFFLIGAQLDALPNAPRPWPKSSVELKWKECEKAFRKFQKFKVNGPYLIPQIAHFVVLDDALATEQLANIERFRKLHPDWQIKIWTEESLDGLTIVNRQALANASSIEERSAIVRYEVLSHIGGVCISPSFVCVRPLDELHQTCEFFTVCSNQLYTLLPDVIGARPHHPIILACQRDVMVNNNVSAAAFTNHFLNLASKFRGRAVALPSYYFPTNFLPKDRKIPRAIFAFQREESE